jgi:hypothetical protein
MARSIDGKSSFPIYKNLDGYPGQFVSRRFITSVSTGDQVVAPSLESVRGWVKELALQYNGEEPKVHTFNDRRRNNAVLELWY